MILESPFPELVIPNINYAEYVLRNIRKFGDEIALIDAENQQYTLTFSQIRDLSIKCASAFKEHGIEKSDVIANCFSNCLELPMILIAAAACGAIITTCNPAYTEDEMKKQFRLLPPKLIIADSQSYRKMKNVAKDIESVKIIISVDETPMCESLSDWIQSSSHKGLPTNVSIDPKNDVFLLPYSSGTTGLPKGVMLTHRNLVAMGEVYKCGVPHTTKDVDYVIPPMFHLFGMQHTMSNLLQGSKTIVGKHFYMEKFLSLIAQYKVTMLSVVPSMLLSIRNSPHLSKYDLSSLMSIMCGSASLPKSVAIDVQKKLCVRVYQGWGLTEGLMTCAGMYPLIPIDSVGVPLPNTQIKVIDVMNGKELGPYEHGELCGKSPLLMKGYYKNPSATSQCLDNEGWLHTGDIGYFDKFGHIFVVDRMKELIKCKGFQVAPAELEQILLQHPCIADAAVVGIPDVKSGELPKAFVVRKSDSLSENDVQRFVAEKVVKYKELKGGVEFIKEIPRTGPGKIKRRDLKTIRHQSKL